MIKRVLLLVTAALLLSQPLFAFAQQRTINLNAKDLLPHTEIFFSPSSGTFIEGSTFEVPIFLNTKKNSVNAVELYIHFDPNKLSVVRPSGGKSIIGLWIEPPSYDNSRGTAKIIGTIPNGITSDSGLIVTITFAAKQSGQAIVSISEISQVLLNDGLATPAIIDTNRGTYTIIPKPPEGPLVTSPSHPFSDRWYNNANTLIEWEKQAGVTGFSYELDNKPNTIPDDTVESSETTTTYQAMTDGLWYFHIKALKRGIWGSTTHFSLRIDTAPPAEFTPVIDYVSAAVINRFLITFETTDSLSGIDHYEIGVIDKSAPLTQAPVFIQTESPYQLPFNDTDNARIIVRAFDKAGNIRDAHIDAKAPIALLKFISDNLLLILFSILLIFVLGSIFHYLFGHHIARRVKHVFALLKKEETMEKMQELKEELTAHAPTLTSTSVSQSPASPIELKDQVPPSP